MQVPTPPGRGLEHFQNRHGGREERGERRKGEEEGTEGELSLVTPGEAAYEYRFYEWWITASYPLHLLQKEDVLPSHITFCEDLRALLYSNVTFLQSHAL